MTGFYLHFPFCIKKCAYCDFYSKTDVSFIGDYVAELEREIRALSSFYPTKKIETIYFGGGTPSLMSVRDISRLVGAIRESFLSDIKEVTFEVNPSSAHDFFAYRDAGVTRVSVGVQSLNDNTLKTIGRLHTADEALSTLRAVKNAGLRVSADLMLALPGEDERDIDRFLKGVAPYVGHISAYLLKLEEGTALFQTVKSGKLCLPDDDRAADLYQYAYQELARLKFQRYEISNFAKVGEESLHNLIYWNMDEYFGAGAAAHSFLDGKRSYNVSDIPAYLCGEHGGNAKSRAEDDRETLAGRCDEAVMLALRTAKGLDLEDFKTRFKADFNECYRTGLSAAKPYLLLENGKIMIKSEYLLLENAILLKLLQ